MVKILQLCAVDFTAYHLLRPLGLGLRDAGFDVTFCCSPGKGLDLLGREGFGIEPVPISRSYNIARHMVSFARIHRLLRRGRFDILHAHTPVAGLIGRAAARLAGVSAIVYSAHGFYFHEGMSGPVKGVFIRLERFGGKLSDLVFVQSEEDWREAVRERVAPMERLIHIGNGVDPLLFGRHIYEAAAGRLRMEFDIGDAPVIGFVGRIVREKGAVEFVRAAAEVKRSRPGIKFIMTGVPLPSDRDGCWHEIEELKIGLGLGRDLVMTGYRTDVPAILSLFDIFVMSSYREGMPRSLLEAMATGIPAVATDIRGCREEVIDGVTGLLVPPRDHGALAREVERLLAEPELAASMGRAARQRVNERFDERRVVALQVEHFKRLAAELHKK